MAIIVRVYSNNKPLWLQPDFIPHQQASWQRPFSFLVPLTRNNRCQQPEMTPTSDEEEELRTLCSDSGLHYDDLCGNGKAAEARELVGRMERHGRVTELDLGILRDLIQPTDASEND